MRGIRAFAAVVVLTLCIGAVCHADLFKAVRAGNTAKVTELLAAGADPNTTNEEGETPLHVAARHGRPQIAKLLLDNGALVKGAGECASTPLHTAIQHAQAEVVRVLLEHGANVHDRYG